MILEDFKRLAAAGSNRIPLMRRVLGDLETPLSAYLKLGRGPHSYLFESVLGGERWGRYSIIGLPAREVVRITDKTVRRLQDGVVVEEVAVADPLAWVADLHARFRVPALPHLPRFTGGLVGYFGFDTVRWMEPKLDKPTAPDPLGCPDCLLMVSTEVLVFDNLSGEIYLIIHVDPASANAYEAGLARLDALEATLHGSVPVIPIPAPAMLPVTETDFHSLSTQAGFEAAVVRVKKYIEEGDCMQVVLSQRLTAPFKAPPLDLYRALRSVNPSPYLYFLDLDDFHIVGSSPEILVHVEEGRITVRPIAGTRRRGETVEEDLALERELLADPKECAEHLMLIDLGRNDAGRVAEIGTVKVTEKMVIERYSHVMHIVSNVTARLRPGVSALDALRATFPAGTVSGAPKIRAMEIIDELEPVKRGVYAGAVGYLSWSGNMDTAIAIRTAVVKDGTVHVQAGAGIVADSVPISEWEETMNKARALFRAVTLATKGLKLDPP
jgi:anthranilate synthase component 1